jgi:hypothetical protein
VSGSALHNLDTCALASVDSGQGAFQARGRARDDNDQ